MGPTRGIPRRWIELLVALAIAIQLALAQLSGGGIVIDLRKHEWTPPERHQFVPSLVIDHENRVLVGFSARSHTGLVSRDRPSLDFHIMRFTRDGKVDLSISVPSNESGGTGVYLSDTDQIIARANGKLQLLEAGAWKTLAPCSDQCLVIQSHSRHTLHVSTSNATVPTLLRLSPQPASLSCGMPPGSIKDTADQIQNFPQSITDEYAYFSGSDGSYRWPLCQYEHRRELPRSIDDLRSVMNDQVFLSEERSHSGDHTEVSVIGFDGRVLFQPEIAKPDSESGPIASDQVERVAAQIVTRVGGNRFLDIDSDVTSRRIVVYDIHGKRLIASVPAQIKYKYGFEYQLSPDGQVMAILEDNILRVIDFSVGSKPVAGLHQIN